MDEAKKTVGFWVGGGVLGKGIKFGDPILEGSVDPKTIAAQKKLGNIQDSEISQKNAENIMVAETLLKEANDKCVLLEKQVEALEKAKAKLEVDIEALKSESEEVLKAKNETLKSELAKSEKEVKKLQKAAK